MNAFDDNNLFCRLLDLRKIEKRISGSSFNGVKLAFLILSGSFNPIHTEHLRMLTMAKSFLEKNNYTIVAGFMVLSGNSYLKDKLGTQAYPLEQRIELCRLAIKPYEWIYVAIKEELSSKWACQQVKNEPQNHCNDVFKNRELTGIEIMGSDSFVRIFSKVLHSRIENRNDEKRTICCLIRPGADSIVVQEYIERTMIPELASLAINVLIPDPSLFNSYLKEISSTAIRRLIAREEWGQLEENEWLPLEVLNRLNKKKSY